MMELSVGWSLGLTRLWAGVAGGLLYLWVCENNSRWCKYVLFTGVVLLRMCYTLLQI